MLEEFRDFRKGAAVPKMGKEEMDLLAMVDRLKRGEFSNLVSF
jgi:hypothetical protein